MKIEINNFGPISNFKFDLAKDLHIIFGRNNIGKSYAITALYLIVKHMIKNISRIPYDIEMIYFVSYHQKQTHLGPSPIFDEVDKIFSVAKFKKEQGDEIDITKSVEAIIFKLVSGTFVEDLGRSFSNSFDSIEGLNNKCTDTAFTIRLDYNDFEIIIGSSGKKLVLKEFKLKQIIVLKKSKTNKKPKKDNSKTTVYIKPVTKENKVDQLSNFIKGIVLPIYFNYRDEIVSIINSVYFLPASRSGLYQALSTFSAVIAELSKSRNFLTNTIELPNISEPVSDYFLNLSNISTSKAKGLAAKIAKEIEQEILEGEIKINQESKKIVFASQKIKSELDLSVTSSMVSEIAPIVAYLKFVIGEEGKRV